MCPDWQKNIVNPTMCKDMKWNTREPHMNPKIPNQVGLKGNLRYNRCSVQIRMLQHNAPKWCMSLKFYRLCVQIMSALSLLSTCGLFNILESTNQTKKVKCPTPNCAAGTSVLLLSLLSLFPPLLKDCLCQNATWLFSELGYPYLGLGFITGT